MDGKEGEREGGREGLVSESEVISVITKAICLPFQLDLAQL